MPSAAGGGTDSLPLRHEIITVLEAEASSIAHDERFVYAACKDQRIRVWSKKDWQTEAVLGETSSEPLFVHVDEENVYATCERRVYVWSKESWGMLGWFELSYQAITSTLQDDYFHIGSRDGRLVSIKKDTHETSSWQLHKSDISSLWSDSSILCTCTKKEPAVVWTHGKGKPPTEITKLDEKEKDCVISGNDEFVIIGHPSEEIKIWDRVEWENVKTLTSDDLDTITSLWANNLYLIAASENGIITLWDLKKGNELGSFKLNDHKPELVDADHSHIYCTSSDGVVVVKLTYQESSLDLSSLDGREFGESMLRTSPYDVLEDALQIKIRGDKLLTEGEYSQAVTEYETSLQLLIDNTHALLEVPKEREKLTNEVNERLGKALLRQKIQEIQELEEKIEQISDELELKGRTNITDEEIEELWRISERAIKESRVLAEAQADNMLSYQLTFVTDNLEDDLIYAKEKVDKYKEKVNQALALTQSVMSEWRWMERKRTSLQERSDFLEGAISRLEERLDESEDDEVKEILTGALEEHQTLYDQISRILSASDEEEDTELSNREDAIDAIQGLLKVMPKKRATIAGIKDTDEKKVEQEKLLSALDEALETAEIYELEEEIIQIKNEINSVKSLIDTDISTAKKSSEEVES